MSSRKNDETFGKIVAALIVVVVLAVVVGLTYVINTQAPCCVVNR